MMKLVASESMFLFNSGYRRRRWTEKTFVPLNTTCDMDTNRKSWWKCQVSGLQEQICRNLLYFVSISSETTHCYYKRSVGMIKNHGTEQGTCWPWRLIPMPLSSSYRVIALSKKMPIAFESVVWSEVLLQKKLIVVGFHLCFSWASWWSSSANNEYCVVAATFGF